MSVREKFVSATVLEYGQIPEKITREQIENICVKHRINFPQWLTNNKASKIEGVRGVYLYKEFLENEKENGDTDMAARKKPIASSFVSKGTGLPRLNVNLQPQPKQQKEVEPSNMTYDGDIVMVPEKVTGYVPFDNYSTIESVIKSNLFFTCFITGLSGNGKTMMVEQACANTNREFIRVNITVETDEDDLFGGFRLVDGNMQFHSGPVISAMERGAVLLLDEVDLASNKIMCLQPILEGKPLYIKKTGKMVHPKKGFNIIATANTKGQGSIDGKFVGTNVLNEAFLERFSITLEQEYPSAKVETQILQMLLSKCIIDRGYLDQELDNKAHLDFIDLLVRWAGEIRKCYNSQIITDVITTRRLTQIIMSYSIFNFNKKNAVNLALNRFDAETKATFMDLYSKIDKDIILENQKLEEEAKLKLAGIEIPAPKPVDNTPKLDPISAILAKNGIVV